MELWEKNLYSLWVAQFIAAVGISMVVPFLPFYLKEIGVTGSQAVQVWSGLIVAAPFMVGVFMQPLWGILGDRHGRKPMVVRGMLGMGLANILMGFAHTAPLLLIFRFFQGGVSGFVAPSLALLSSSTPEERTGRALGILQSALISGMIVGPLLGGLLAHFMGYRAIFFWTGFFCLTAMFIVIKFVKEDFKKQGRRESSSLRHNILMVVNSPELRFLFLLLVLVQFCLNFVAPFLSLYVELLKVSPEYIALMTGLVFGITGVTNAATAAPWGRRADKVGYRKVLRYCLMGITLSYLPQAFVSDAYQLLVLRAGLGIFVGGVMPTINTLVRQSTSERDRGGIYGIFQSGLLLGNMVGPLLGALLAATLGLRATFLITAGISFVVTFWERKIDLANHKFNPSKTT